MGRGTDLTGIRFGKLTVIQKTEQTRNGYYVWRCRCDCGGEIFANTKQLRRGTISDCGCRPKETARRGAVAEDLTGRRFGRLTVIKRAENRGGRTCWECRCDCGTLRMVTAHDLKAGKVKSCGCLVREQRANRVDLTGRRFGRLKVLYTTGRTNEKGSIIWHCVCDCGNELDLSENALVHGNYQSCGCLKKENQKEVFKRLHFQDGTCIELLEKRKFRCDNTSGFRGVYQMKNGRFRVNIGFKKKRYYIGSFDSYEDAVQARQDVEQMIHGVL